MRPILLVILFSYTVFSFAQVTEFETVNQSHFIDFKNDIDPEAEAITILETGTSFIEVSDRDRGLRVFHNYKTRIKILNQEGLEHANIVVPLYLYGKDFEYIEDIKGITYNAEEGRIQQTLLQKQSVITENKSEYVKLVKFTLPNVKVGSIIEFEYKITSPDIFNYRSWEFQSDIPKIRSEYNARIPAICNYNVTLQGFLKLDDTKSRIETGCMSVLGMRVNCSNITYIMSNIPAFKEEAYMLAPKNYISTINFELKEMTNPNGGVTKYTKDWKDVDIELLTDKDFGGQLKKLNFFKERIPKEIIALEDPHIRAQAINKWVSNHIKFNNIYGKYAKDGIEKAFERKSGNVGDINLALIAALNAANIEAYPIILSTRNNGLPHDLHPVLSNFNYVIAGIKIGNDIIFADATEPLLPFSQLPLHCVNGNGRIIYSKKSSEWIELKSNAVSVVEYVFDGKLDNDGFLKGKLNINSHGMEGFEKRKSIAAYPTFEEYYESWDDKNTQISISNGLVHNLENPENLLIEEYDIEVQFENKLTKEQPFLINPIFIARKSKNPFNLDERTYAVDLGAKRNEKHVIRIELPKGMVLKNMPAKKNIGLPENSARYFYETTLSDNILQVTQQLALNKSIYSSDEYFGLKEIFSRIIQQMQIDHEFTYQPHE